MFFRRLCFRKSGLNRRENTSKQSLPDHKLPFYTPSIRRRSRKIARHTRSLYFIQKPWNGDFLKHFRKKSNSCQMSRE
ncbi:MAG: hypothetical protein D6714_12895 [Bacteroidetes bacterium]|nr:MAG: hypothetical protein D6714_12895 [Bacteroidota bacterium]